MSAARLWCERALPRELLPLLGAGVELLPPASESPDEPWRAVGEADAVIASSRLRYDRAMMGRAPRLQVIARTGIGVDNVEIAEATRRGIAVCNTPDAPSQSTAEHAIAMLLALAKGLRPAHQALARGERRDFFATHRGIELKGRTLGLIGLGRIGALVAGLAKALGMRALAYDPFLDATRCAALGAEHAPTLDAALAASDAVSLHMPLTESTRGIIGAAQLALMRPGALLINCARGGMVDEAALLAALESGRLGGAALDVFASEPPPADHPLLLRDDVIATPHVAPATVEGRARLWRDALANALAVLAGRRPANLVNRELAQPLASIQGQP
jgi:D-3-phosphoglycerate dehydrogenase